MTFLRQKVKIRPVDSPFLGLFRFFRSFCVSNSLIDEIKVVINDSEKKVDLVPLLIYGIVHIINCGVYFRVYSSYNVRKIVKPSIKLTVLIFKGSKRGNRCIQGKQ